MKEGPMIRMRSRAFAAAVALLAGGCDAKQDPPPADLVILHGKVYAADGKEGFHQAVAIRENKIVAVGADKDIEAYRGSDTRMIDATGKTVIPGLIDNHVHLMAGAEALDGPRLEGARTASEVQERLKSYVESRPGDSWIRGNGGYATFTGLDLDAVTGDRPVTLWAGDGHSVYANSAAMKRAGITKQTAAPAGGEIVKDPATGELNGIFRETAQALVQDAIPGLESAEAERLLALATAEAHKAGVTTIVNIASPPELEVFDKVRRDGNLNVRLYNALWLTPPTTAGLRPGSGFPSIFTFSDADADAFDALRKKYANDDKLKMGMVKIMLDGVIESHTAYMLEPYADMPGQGEANYTPDALNRAIAMMDGRGWQVMTHALGDAAIRMALDAYEHTEKANPAPPGGRRPKIEHMETIDPADIPRFKTLNVTASLQPAHAGGMLNPKREGRRWTYLGFERSAWGFPWKSFRDAGVHIAFGSDWPVASLNTGRSMTVARGRLSNPPIPDQNLKMTEIVDAYTRDGAYAIFEERNRGSLEAGKLADVVIVEGDIFENPPAGDLPVAMTIFDGKVVYEKP